ncbi:hypothetical protein [Persicirhabdus sediminis]|uniref:Uncharacterized protein n=1 Tax=Persicirhabdus sediminis TaxID=454144 RepID=A0A8J7MBB5_9BACT|nr:hypothetical protein [Persicirhabdus sediminis]MBK1789893.1 hypothetical protein [Persicirhabdus sediminis]
MDDLSKLESQLEQLKPEEMPSDMLARMEQAMCRWQDHVPAEEEKVIAFPQDTPTKQEFKWGMGMSAAAAAVAIMGAVSALMFTGDTDPSASMAQKNAALPPVPEVASPPQTVINGAMTTPATTVVVPDSVQQNVVRASDAGIVTEDGKVPHRFFKIDVLDRIQLKDGNGRVYDVERPGVRYIMLPVETE